MPKLGIWGLFAPGPNSTYGRTASPEVPPLTCSLGFSNVTVRTQDADQATTASGRGHLVLQVSTLFPPLVAFM